MQFSGDPASFTGLLFSNSRLIRKSFNAKVKLCSHQHGDTESCSSHSEKTQSSRWQVSETGEFFLVLQKWAVWFVSVSVYTCPSLLVSV